MRTAHTLVRLVAMDLSTLKEWLVPASTTIGIIGSATAAIVALNGLKLKFRAEARQADISGMESDVKLIKLFVEIMEVAHARGASVIVSDKLFEVLWPEIKAAGSSNPRDAALITLPVGSASQDAAIAAIGVLGEKHEILYPVAVRALESIAEFKPQTASSILIRLRNNGPPKKIRSPRRRRPWARFFPQ